MCLYMSLLFALPGEYANTRVLASRAVTAVSVTVKLTSQMASLKWSLQIIIVVRSYIVC